MEGVLTEGGSGTVEGVSRSWIMRLSIASETCLGGCVDTDEAGLEENGSVPAAVSDVDIGVGLLAST